MMPSFCVELTLPIDANLREIHQWLSAPDPSTNHNADCKKRQPNTGSWFAENKVFKKWKAIPGSFLWLHARPVVGRLFSLPWLSRKPCTTML